MESFGIFNETLGLLGKVLDIRSKKHNLIASNLANIDTPGYKAFDLAVEEELKRMHGANVNVNFKRTQPEHMMPQNAKSGGLKVSLRTGSHFHTNNGDNNTVDMDKEMAEIAENSLLYTAFTQIISKKFSGLKDSIHGGKK